MLQKYLLYMRGYIQSRQYETWDNLSSHKSPHFYIMFRKDYPNLYEFSLYAENDKIIGLFWVNGEIMGGTRVHDKETIRSQINTILDNM